MRVKLVLFIVIFGQSLYGQNPSFYFGSSQTSFQSSLQGKYPGIFIQGGSGKLAQAINLKIRGTTSIHGNNQPLYVVDGHPISDLILNCAENEPLNRLTFMNPADIETVEIISDASAAAQYGGRAANGVVLITTRRGKDGDTKFTFNSQIGYSDPARKVEFLNRKQYLSLVETGFNNVVELYGGSAGSAYDWLGLSNNDTYDMALDQLFPFWRDADDPANLAKGPNTNWTDQIFRKGLTQEYNISASGGKEKIKYFASLSWSDQESFIIGHEFDRIGGRVNFDYNPNSKLAFTLNLNTTKSKLIRIPEDNSFESLMGISSLPPLDPLYIPGSGNFNDQTLYPNPLISIKEYNNTADFTHGLGSISAQYSFTKNLILRANIGGILFRFTELLNTTDTRVITTSLNTNQSYYLTFNKYFSTRFSITLKGGLNFNRIDNNVNVTSNSALNPYTNSNYKSYYLISSFDLNKKIYLDISARYEGSSVFNSENRYRLFPFASVSWIIFQKDITKASSIIDLLKFSAGIGLSGSDLFTATNYITNDLDWQTIRHLDFGLESALIDNRLVVDINYYQKRTSNAFTNLSVLFSEVLMNLGSVENRGWEFEINTANLTGEFVWNTGFNISRNKNKVLDLEDHLIAEGNWRIIEGQPIGVFFMPEYAGVDQDNGDALFYTDETRTTKTNNLGAADPQIVGDPNPDFTGGIVNTFRYKGFDFSFMFQFVTGNEIFYRGRQWQADGLSWLDNQTAEFYENYWKNPGDNSKYPQPRFLEGNGYGVSSMLVFDGSYIRLKDLTLGYSLNADLISKYRISSLRVYVSGFNLLTFSKYPGWDPEIGYFGAGSSANVNTIRQGYDYFTTPQPKIISFGVQLGF